MPQLLKYSVVLFEKIEKRGVPAYISSFFILGLLPFLLLLIFFSEELYLFDSLAIYLIFIWFVFSRYIVYLGYSTAQTSLERFEELFLDVEKFKEKNKKLCDNFYSNKAVLIALPFSFYGAYLVNSFFSEASFGLHIWLTVVTILLLSHASIGIWNAFGAMNYFIDILKDKLNINPLHPDGFGGLEPIGDFIIKSTLIISTGSFVVPFALMAVSDNIIGGEIRFITLILTAVYFLIVLLSFVIPLLKLNKIAKSNKYRIVKEKVEIFNKLLEDLLKNPTTENHSKVELFHSTLLVEINKMKIWPFTGLTIIQILGAVALPSTTLALQILEIL